MTNTRSMEMYIWSHGHRRLSTGLALGGILTLFESPALESFQLNVPKQLGFICSSWPTAPLKFLTRASFHRQDRQQNSRLCPSCSWAFSLLSATPTQTLHTDAFNFTVPPAATQSLSSPYLHPRLSGRQKDDCKDQGAQAHTCMRGGPTVPPLSRSCTVQGWEAERQSCGDSLAIWLWCAGCPLCESRRESPASEVKTGRTTRRGLGGRSILQKVTLVCMQRTPGRQTTFWSLKNSCQ